MSLLDEIQALRSGSPTTKIVENAPTTDQVDKISPEERRQLVAYCDNCTRWWKFVRDMKPNKEEEVCPDCGGKPSSKIGFQLTTQRSFNPLAKKMTKAELKRFSGS